MAWVATCRTGLVRLCFGLHVLPDGMYRVLCVPPYPQGHLLSLTYLIFPFAEIIFPFKLAIASIYSDNIKKSISKIDEAVCLCTLFRSTCKLRENGELMKVLPAASEL